MSRFECYGTKPCKTCRYYRKSNRCPAFRCDYPDNLRSNWMGTVYMKTPDGRNIFNKCEWHEYIDSPKEEIEDV